MRKVLVLCSILCLVMVSVASPITLVVKQDGTGDHTTVSAAEAAANDGDVIEIQDNGYYDEEVMINRDLDVAGITIQAGATFTPTIRNLEVDDGILYLNDLNFNPGTTGWAGYGIEVDNSGGAQVSIVEVTNCNITGYLNDCFDIDDAATTVVITNCLIDGELNDLHCIDISWARVYVTGTDIINAGDDIIDMEDGAWIFLDDCLVSTGVTDSLCDMESASTAADPVGPSLFYAVNCTFGPAHECGVDQDDSMDGSEAYQGSWIILDNCVFENIIWVDPADDPENDAIDMDACKFLITNTDFYNMMDKAIDGEGTTGTCINCTFINCGENALDPDNASSFTAIGCTFTNIGLWPEIDAIPPDNAARDTCIDSDHSHVILQDCTFTNVGSHVVDLDYDPSSYPDMLTGLLMSNCTIDGSEEGDGVQIDDVNQVCAIANCSVSNCDQGLEIDDATVCVVTNTQCTNNGDGCEIDDDSVVSFTDCTFSSNDDDGLIVTGDSQITTLDNCDILDNVDAGLYCYDDGDGPGHVTSATNCVIAGNGGDDMSGNLELDQGEMNIDYSIIALGQVNSGIFMDDALAQTSPASLTLDHCDIFEPTGNDAIAFSIDEKLHDIEIEITCSVIVATNGAVNPDNTFISGSVSNSVLWCSATAISGFTDTANVLTSEPLYMLPFSKTRNGYRYLNEDFNICPDGSEVGSQGSYEVPGPLRVRNWSLYN